MSDVQRPGDSDAPAAWAEAALAAVRSPSSPVACPACGAGASVSAAWNVTDLGSREAVVGLSCASCGALQDVRVALPPVAPPFHPVGLVAAMLEAVGPEVADLMDRVRRQVTTMPAALFTTDPLWEAARWSATTFRWHPAGEAPPLMGLVFDDGNAGRELFRKLVGRQGNADRFEEIRVSIIEGGHAVGEAARGPGEPGLADGYTVHLCPDPDALCSHTVSGDPLLDRHLPLFFGRWNRMYPQPGSPPMVARFKAEVRKHREYLLAPVTRRPDGQLWFDVELGIVKHTAEFRDLKDIGPDDVDAAAAIVPSLITPPVRQGA